MTDTFSRNVMISMVGHLAVMLLIFFRAVTAPADRFDLRNAIRVDVVDLPKKMTALPEVAPEKPAPAPAEKPKELPKKAELKPAKTHAPETPSPKAKKLNTEKSQKHALDKLKAMEALEKIQEEVGKEKSAKAKSPIVAGNQVNAGNALSGLERIEYDRYFEELQKKILSQWSIPQWLADNDLKAKVLVLIDERGYVLKKIFRQSSGNEIFDAKVMEAIDSSSPLPPPPQRLRGLLSTSGIVFNFPQ